MAWIVWSGIQHTKDSKEIEGFFLAKRSLPWWAVGLSVMAAQLSAITLIGTTGQAYDDGMRFLQFYYALPVAMGVLSLTVVPFFHRAKIYTAYEFLERRFDARTRSLTSLLFLVSRATSCGIVISAPAVILSIVLGWNFTVTVLALSLPTIVYTMLRRGAGGGLGRCQADGRDRRRCARGRGHARRRPAGRREPGERAARRRGQRAVEDIWAMLGISLSVNEKNHAGIAIRFEALPG